MTTNTKSLTHFLAAQWHAARVRFRAGVAGVRDLPTRRADFKPVGTVLIPILLATMAVFSPMSLAATRWVTVQLTDDDVYDSHYLNTGQWNLSDTCVVWRKGGDFEPDVYDDTEIYALRLVDGVIPTKDDVVRITTNSVDDSHPAVNDDCLITWRQNGDTIIVNDWTTEVWRASNRYFTSQATLINNMGHVAWLQVDPPSSGNDWDVFLYDGDTIHQLTTNLYSEDATDFRLAENGDMVWLSRSDIADAEVFFYQGIPDPPALTDNYHDEDFPNINSLGQLVWTDEENPNALQVKWYNGTSIENVFPPTSGGDYTPKPRINDNGYIVADILGPDNFIHVYMYDPNYGGSVRQLTTGPDHGLWPAVNNNQQVVWYATPRFSPFNSDSAPTDIFLDDNGRRIRLTTTERPDNSLLLPGNSFPQINDKGYVMWLYDVWPKRTETREIMMAVPIEVPETQWAAIYGSDDWDAAADIIETDDGGYLIAGSTRHVEETESAVPSETDAWLVKLDHDGAIEWEKRYGGPEQDVAACVHETDDGYVMAGTTESYGAGGQDAWLVKVDKAGNVIWEKAYGALNDEEVACVDVMYAGKSDYVVATTSNSFASGGDFTHTWVFKVDRDNGDIVWQKVYAQSAYDRADSIEETRDGGFVIGGTTYAPEFGNRDFWVLKLDENGVIEWQKAYGQNEWVPADPWFEYLEWNAYIRQTWDGGYILAGTSSSNNTSQQSAWVLKLDPDGAIEWEKWGGVPHVTDVQQTRRGDYVVLGRTGSPVVDYTFDNPRQGMLMKLDDAGEVLWEGTYTLDPAGDDEFEAIVQTWDDGYIVAGRSSYSLGNAWVLKLDDEGMASEGCEAVEMDSDGYSLPGSTNPRSVNTTATGIVTSAAGTATTATVDDTTAAMGSGCEVIPPDLIDLAKTGQTVTEVPGDDGDLQLGVTWPNPRFIDNGDGTVSDLLTGLMWLKDANCANTIGYDPTGLGDGLMTLSQGLGFVADINDGTHNITACAGYSGDYDDWRVTNIIELTSLVNWGVYPVTDWLVAQGLVNVELGYLSSTPMTGIYTGYSWYLHMYSGMNDDLRPTSAQHVWPVRAGQRKEPDPDYPANLWRTGVTVDNPLVPGDDGELQAGVAWPAPRFFDQGDGTIIDGLTGLMWLKNVNCLEGPFNWWDAISAVQSLNDGTSPYVCDDYAAEYDDWRMPNMLELTSMVDWSRWSTIFPGDFVFDAGGYFWTSTSYPYGSFPWLQAWAMDGANGKTWTFLKGYDIAPKPFNVWPVRTTLDTDGDGVLDGEDNCIMVANGPDIPDAGGNIQLDVDGDGYGNICDPDFDNSGIVNAADLAYMKTSFFTPDAEADLDGSGVVNAADLAILKTMFFKPPGPSCCGIPLP